MFQKEIKEKLSLFLIKSKAEQGAILLSIYIFIYFVNQGIGYFLILSTLLTLIFVVVALVGREQLVTSKFWLLTTFLLVLGIIDSWHGASNHIYLMVYLSLLLVFAFSQPKEKQEEYFKKQARYIFALVMVIAGLQKLFAPQYANGSVLELMFLTGDLASNLLNHQFAFANEIAANKALVKEFESSYVEGLTLTLAWKSPFFNSIAKPMAWLIITSEIALGVLALWFFQNRVYQIAVIAFAAGIFIVTPEGGFLALLLILAWSQLPKEHSAIHHLYLYYLLFILTFLITGISQP